jgi:hypothetical protein
VGGVRAEARGPALGTAPQLFAQHGQVYDWPGAFLPYDEPMTDETARRERAEATRAILVQHGFSAGSPEAVSAARSALDRASGCDPADIEAQNRHVREWAARQRRSVA